MFSLLRLLGFIASVKILIMLNLLIGWIILIISIFLAYMVRKQHTNFLILLVVIFVLGLVVVGISGILLGDVLHDAGYI
jgi:hypothetical protein